MFRSALARGEKIGAGPVLRAWRGLLVFLSRWFQIESLYKFNAKFRPRWEPRFVVYRTSSDLPRIGLAAMQAEGFVTLALPRILSRRTKTPAHAPTQQRRGARYARCERTHTGTRAEGVVRPSRSTDRDGWAGGKRTAPTTTHPHRRTRQTAGGLR